MQHAHCPQCGEWEKLMTAKTDHEMAEEFHAEKLKESAANGPGSEALSLRRVRIEAYLSGLAQGRVEKDAAIREVRALYDSIRKPAEELQREARTEAFEAAARQVECLFGVGAHPEDCYTAQEEYARAIRALSARSQPGEKK